MPRPTLKRSRHPVSLGKLYRRQPKESAARPPRRARGNGQERYYLLALVLLVLLMAYWLFGW